VKKIGKSALSKKPSSRRSKSSVTNLKNPISLDSTKVYEWLGIISKYAKVRSPTFNEFLTVAIAQKDLNNPKYYTPAERKEEIQQLTENYKNASNYQGIRDTWPFIFILTNPKTKKEEAVTVYFG